MALNSFTAQKLYENGILDYIPTDLISGPIPGAGLANLNGHQYLNYAMQGNLYSNYNHSCDSFTSTNTNSAQHINLNPTAIGTKSNVASNALGFFGIGSKSTAGAHGFGFEGIGSKSNISFESSFGGFQDARDKVSNVTNTMAGIPKPVWGILSFAIGALTLVSLFKGKKKPVTYYKEPGFFSRLNPFKKSVKTNTNNKK